MLQVEINGILDFENARQAINSNSEYIKTLTFLLVGYGKKSKYSRICKTVNATLFSKEIKCIDPEKNDFIKSFF